MFGLQYDAYRLTALEHRRRADQYRLRKLVTADRPTISGRFMVWTGRRLVAAGQRLQSRAAAPTPVVVYQTPKA